VGAGAASLSLDPPHDVSSSASKAAALPESTPRIVFFSGQGIGVL
jgi:hypothetical protein